MNPFFDWLKDSGTQGMLVMVGTLAAIVAAIGTIYFGRKSLTKRDLAPMEENTAAATVQLGNVHSRIAAMTEDIKRVEGNTAETSEHLENVHSHLATMNKGMDTQHERDALVARANRSSLKIMGDGDRRNGIRFSITARDAAVVLSRVELCRESGHSLGSVDCEMTENPLQVFVTLDVQTFTRWVEAGTMNPFNVSSSTLYLRLHMSFKGSGEEVCRPITIASTIHEPTPVSVFYRLFADI